MIGQGLAALPQKLLAEFVGLVIEAAVVAGVTWHFAGEHYTAKFADERQAQLVAVAAAAASAAETTNRREDALQETAHAAQVQASAARADADSAAHARDALRMQLSAFVRAHRGGADPVAPAGSAPAGDAIDVLADVLSRADARAGELAELADQRGIAGAACEHAYDALNGAAK